MSGPLQLQIAVDCADPHRLVRFWSAALGLETEDHHDMITDLLSQGVAGPADVVIVDGRQAWKTAAACKDPEGRLPRLLFQLVEEPKVVKNRVHLDIHAFPEDREAEVARLLSLGATRLWDGQQGPQTWVTLADPEGNEFCLS